MIQAWLIRMLHFAGHSEWFRGGHVTQAQLMNVSLRTFAGAVAVCAGAVSDLGLLHAELHWSC